MTDTMDPRSRDPPLTRDDCSWRRRLIDDTTCACYFPSGFAWFFDNGEKRDDLTKYGWTGIHELVDAYGASGVELQYGLQDLPSITGIGPVLRQVKAPTEYDHLGGIAGTSDEEEPLNPPEAWLWVNGEAWYFDGAGTPIREFERLGWQGLHRYLDRYDADDPEFSFRLAASITDTSLVDPRCAGTVRKMLREPD